MPFSGPSAAALSRPLTSCDRRRPLDLEDAIGQRGVEQRHADGDAVEPAVQLRVDQADGRGRAGRRRDQRQGGSPGPAQVLVRRVHDGLRVGHVVDGRDDAVPDADALVDHLDDRGQAVRRAGSGGQQVVLVGPVEVVVDAHDDVERPFLHRGGDDDLAHAAPEVGGQRLRRAELAGAFQDDVDAQVLPGHFAGRRDAR